MRRSEKQTDIFISNTAEELHYFFYFVRDFFTNRYFLAMFPKCD